MHIGNWYINEKGIVAYCGYRLQPLYTSFLALFVNFLLTPTGFLFFNSQENGFFYTWQSCPIQYKPFSLFNCKHDSGLFCFYFWFSFHFLHKGEQCCGYNILNPNKYCLQLLFKAQREVLPYCHYKILLIVQSFHFLLGHLHIGLNYWENNYP